MANLAKFWLQSWVVVIFYGSIPPAYLHFGIDLSQEYGPLFKILF